MCTPNANERKNIVRKDMKMNKLRLTNKIENHFYLDFNWKDRCAASYVSRRVAGPKTRFLSHDTDRIGKLSVSVAGGPWDLDIECVKHTTGAFCGHSA